MSEFITTCSRVSGLAGAGTHPGAGVPGVVLSAAATCHAIAQDFGFQPPVQAGPMAGRARAR